MLHHQPILIIRTFWLSAMFFSLAASALPGADGNAAQLPPAVQKEIDYERDIHPIFAAKCFSCHGPERQRGGFRLDQPVAALRGGDAYAPDILPGKSGESPLIQFVAHLVPEMKMPPEGERLSPEQIGILRAWIDQGAKWPAALAASEPEKKLWSLQPLQVIAPPAIRHPHVGENPIDAFIMEKLQAAGLSPSPPADRPTLMRRLYFDLLGLPPAPDELQAFCNDASPQAYDKLVEHALASPRYGERWARHWLDVVRFAETNGFETNVERPNAWHYRDYVIDAFNSDKPYDRFVFEQLAGDTVGADSATGFLVGGPFDQVKSPDPVLTSMQRSDELADMTNTTATTFLALTVGCARCHHHKFDPITQNDYYALQAVFAGVQHGERPLQREESVEQKQQIAVWQQRLDAGRAALEKLRPQQTRGATHMIDDEVLLSGTAAEPGSSGVSVLHKPAGHGENPTGTARGQRGDTGDIHRFPNVSGGRYTWWSNQPGETMLAYHLGSAGRYRLWLSWGCGFATHTQDAQYILDLDGDRATTSDQTVIATVDQQQFAVDSVAQLPSQPLWSGFRDAGVHEITAKSLLLLRCGKTGTAITADVIACEQVNDHQVAAPLQPPLRAAVNSRENIERFPPTLAKWVRFTSVATNNGSEPCLDEVEIFASSPIGGAAQNVALAAAGVKLSSSGDYQGNPAHRLEHLNDGKYGNSFSWIANTRNKGWVQIELAEPVMIDRVVWGRDRSGGYKDRTSSEYVIEVATELGKWTIVATGKDRIPTGTPAAEAMPHLAYFGLTKEDAAQAKSLSAEIKQASEQVQKLTAKPMAYAGRFTPPGATHRLFRGDPLQPREVVQPNCLSALGKLPLPENAKEAERRVALANWLIDPAKPLTARVMVNRVWQYHFGTGLVDTPSDFGANGGRPSHPELLDWLAAKFMQEGWSLKKLHRWIVSSNTYRQANVPQQAGMERDAQCRLLWRYPPHRLEAESIRDSMLATSGSLDLRMGGPGWSTFKPNSNYVRVYDPKEEFGPAEWRRAVYMTKIRMRQDGVFGAFDCPDAGQIAPKRSRSTTALQALSLFNSRFTLQQAERFADRVKTSAGDDLPRQIQTAFNIAFGRDATVEEAEQSHAFVQEHGLPALCRALYNTNEFLFIP